MRNEARMVGALDAAGYRLTPSRRAVVGLISARSGHFTAADLVADAQRQQFALGRATIFRALDLLIELGAVERLDLPSGDHAYVGCDPVHHHHVVCSSCGRTSEIEDAGLRAVVADVSRRTGFVIDAHRLELFGLCPECQPSGPGSRADA